jgi:hypothetical protein
MFCGSAALSLQRRNDAAATVSSSRYEPMNPGFPRNGPLARFFLRIPIRFANPILAQERTAFARKRNSTWSLPSCFKSHWFGGTCAQRRLALPHAYSKAVTVPVDQFSRRSTSKNIGGISDTEIQLEPETIKCYARQLEQATQMNLREIIGLACCGANMFSQQSAKQQMQLRGATEAEL